MKYAYVVLALAAAVSAQTREDIPKCALPCIDDAIKSESSCATDDYPCVCKSFDKIQGAATGCVLSACGSDVALNEVIPAVQALCQGQSGSSSGGEAPTTSEATTSSPAASPTPETSESSPTSTPASPTGTAPPATEPGTTAPATPVPTAGAAALGSLGGAAIAALAALAL